MFACVENYAKHYDNDMLKINLLKTFNTLHTFPMALVAPKKKPCSFLSACKE